MKLLPRFWTGKSESAARPRAAVQEIGGGVTINTSRELEEYLRTGAAGSSGVPVTPDSAMSVAAVYACVRIISSAVATMPLALKRRVDARTREDASDHPLWDVLRRRPNRWMTPSAFRRMLTMHTLLRGNAYALILRSGGRVIGLWPMHPDRVKVEQLGDMSLAYTYQRKDGQRVVLPQSDVFHLMGPTLDGITGVSPIRYARDTIGLALVTEKHGNTLFKNGTNIGAVLKHPGQLGEEGQELLRKSLEAYRNGGDRAGSALILEEAMEYTPIGMTLEDAQYIDTRKFTRSEIAMFFGVPPHMIGDTEKSTSWGSGIEQQSLGFVAYTLQDWLTTWEETIGRDLIDENEPDLFAKFNTGGLVRGDIKTRYEAYMQGRIGEWLSVNDIRELEDLNPVEDGDRYQNPQQKPAAAPTTNASGNANEPQAAA